jgi:hypothetical protein
MKVRLPIAGHGRTTSGLISSMIQCVTADVSDIEQFYKITFSRTRIHRLRKYYRDKSVELAAVHFDHLDAEDQTDYVLLEKYLDRQLEGLEELETSLKELEHLIEPFASQLIDLVERRQKVVPTTGRYAAEALSAVSGDVTKKLHAIKSDESRSQDPSARFAAYRAVQYVGELMVALDEWMSFYQGYDSEFTWWTSAPFQEVSQQLRTFSTTVSSKLIGDSTGDTTGDIVGQPVGRAGLLADLDAQFIAYTPEELIKIADKEYAWCENEMIKASKALGYKEDWRAALEHVKNLYVEPGQQTRLVHDLSAEAVAYVKRHDMVTVPTIAEECWRTFMIRSDRRSILSSWEAKTSLSLTPLTQCHMRIN